MSSPFKQYGAFVGKSDEDLRVEIAGPDRKNALLILASYSKTPPAVGVTPVAFDEPTFWGRLVVFEGICPIDTGTQVILDTSFDGLKLLLDVDLHTTGPHTFFPPLTQLEGNIQSSAGGTLNVILARARTNIGGQTFIPKLTIGGQIVIGGA